MKSRLKSLAHQVANVATRKKKILTCKNRITGGTWNVKYMNTGKLNTEKDEVINIILWKSICVVAKN